MAQRGPYSQNSLAGQQPPASLAQYPGLMYNQTRHSPQEAQAPMHYSSMGGYGPSSVNHTQDVVQSVPISQRSRAAFARTHQPAYSADYPRTHQPIPNSQAHTTWDARQQGSYGYGQIPSSAYQSQWQSAQFGQQGFANPNAQYMTTNDQLLATTAGSPMSPMNHSPHQWGEPSYMYSGSPLQSPEVPLSSYPFSSVPSPSSSPSPSLAIDMSPILGPRRASVDGTPNMKRCSHCNATSTPLWRRNPMTMQPLCNACGLYLQQRNKLRPQELIDASIEDGESEDESDRDPSAPKCSHCQTHVTSVWRRSKSGEQLCNACGVYLRLRGKPRPLSLKQKKIKPRPHSSKHAAK